MRLKLRNIRNNELLSLFERHLDLVVQAFLAGNNLLVFNLDKVIAY